MKNQVLHRSKPELGFWQIWNICFGYLGIQFGFALQNANISRIFETLGADYSNMAILFVAAPITGLLVQPAIGYFSDKTWGKFGRRRPYLLWGAIAASLALFILPNSPSLWFAAGMLWILDASINVSMEPTRALVGDMLPKSQRPSGFALQTLFIGIASAVASALPWLMTNLFAVSNVAPAGVIPDAVKYSFYIGGSAFIVAVLWTVLKTREYSPEQLQAFELAETPHSLPYPPSNTIRNASQYYRSGSYWVLAGLITSLLVFCYYRLLDKGLFILTFGILAFGLCQWLAARLIAVKQSNNGFVKVMADIFDMPATMRQLAVVQFFSWFPFFAMWTYMTAAVTSHHFGSRDPSSVIYNQGADWVGVLNAVYNGMTIVGALLIPWLVRKLNLLLTHMLCLIAGGIGFSAFVLINDPLWLIVPMLGVGLAWASILGIPYVLLTNAIPAQKMGMYMGMFNYFIVLPQILAASVLGLLVSKVFANQPVYALVTGGVSMLIAAALTLRIKENAK